MPLDITTWLNTIGQRFTHETAADGEKWHLHPCPFCDKNETTGKDTTIFLGSDGRLGFKCFHATCPSTVTLAQAKASGVKRSGWSVLCEKLGRPAIELAGGSASRYPGYRERDQRRGPDVPPLVFDTLSWDELAIADLSLRWLIPEALVAGQPAIIGGASKALKTSLTLDLLTCLAGRGRWLGRFEPPAESVPCLMISGESGQYVIRDTIERIIEERQIVRQGLPLHVATVLPKLSIQEHREATKAEIIRTGAKVFCVDPAYLSLLPPDDRGGDLSVFRTGSILREFALVGEETGATLLLLHHFRKSTSTRASEYGGLATLEELSYSGFSEWARQWVLIKRRSAYRRGAPHELTVNIGGSAGHGAELAVTVEEGDGDSITGRYWRTAVEPYDPEQHDVRGPIARAAQMQRQHEGAKQRILRDLRMSPTPLSVSRIAEIAQLSTRQSQRILNELMAEGRIMQVVHGGRGRSYAFVPSGNGEAEGMFD